MTRGPPDSSATGPAPLWSCPGARRDRADPAAGRRENSRLITASHEENLVRMDGRATFRNAVARLSEITLEVAAEAGVGIDEIDLFVYHQANGRILSAVGERLALDPAKVVDSIANHGNTSAASIPLALDEAQRDGRLGRRRADIARRVWRRPYLGRLHR